jgi:hypothetical protein
MEFEGRGRSIQIPQPIHYKGWIIQPKFDGFYVYDNKDHNKDTALRFQAIGEAYKYVDRKAGGRL